MATLSTSPNAADELVETERHKHAQSIRLMNLGVEDIKKVHDAFQRSKHKIMTKSHFKETLENVMKTSFTDEEYNLFFMRMDEKRNGAVDWDEFVSRMIIELQGKNKVVSKEMWQPPLNSPPHYQSTGHRHPVTRIMFLPAFKQDKTPSSMKGRFVTLSKDGTVNFWSTSFELEKTCHSKTYEKRVHPTWVTDIVCLPDINMMATSSTERDIRFYDTMAMRFELRIVITSFEKSITCMAYHMGSTSDGISHIVTGDMGGNVRIFSFGKGLIIEGRPDVKAGARGPFSFTAGDDVKVYHYKAIKKGILPLLLVTEYLESHPGGEWVRQVAFCPILRSFISCCSCSSEKSLVLRDVRTSIKVDYEFHIPRGVHCFAVNEARYMLATGGTDCAVRVWNPFVPSKVMMAFTGHHEAICGLEFMEGFRLLSVSNDKCVKIWDIAEASCIQTYSQLTSEIGEHTKLSVYFHQGFKKLIVGSLKFAFVPYGPQEDEKNRDGTTHFQSVTKALYNVLFKSLLTVGNDSAIMIWDVWTGKCSSILTEAHTRMEYGLKVPVEITAAAFDPTLHQLLVTGARDGTLKIWNFNTNLCIRHMSIEKNCEVTAVLWLQNRILAVGWNRHITEFADLDSLESAPDEYRRGTVGSTWPTVPRCATRFFGTDLAEKFDGKAWETRHSEDVVSAAANPPQALATASYNGELILWRLETAQPYRRYHVGNPFDRIKLNFKKAWIPDSEMVDSPFKNGTRLQSMRPRANPANPKKLSSKASQHTMVSSSSKAGSKLEFEALKKSGSEVSTGSSRKPTKFSKLIDHSSQKSRKKSLGPIDLPPEQASIRPLVIHSLLFLNTRQCQPNVGTLLVSLEDGHIQVWCHCLSLGNQPQNNPQQDVKKEETENEDKNEKPSDHGFLGSFLAIHTAGDYVVTMNTDYENEYLFTGDSGGYLKVWLLKNYFAPTPQSKVVMPKYRLQFPFLLKDRLNGRAKRAIKGQALPILLSSHQAHMRAITHVEYINEGKILVSCSSDCSVRVWTLGGRYIGTLGQKRPWPDLEHGKEVENIPLRIPYDVSRVASFTSMKVFTGATTDYRSHTHSLALVHGHADITKAEDVITEYDLETKVYGRRADKDHPLGTYFELPKRSGKVHPPKKIDQSYGLLVPVYEHIQCPPPCFVDELSSPTSVERIQNQREMELDQDKPGKTRKRKPKKTCCCLKNHEES